MEAVSLGLHHFCQALTMRFGQSLELAKYILHDLLFGEIFEVTLFDTWDWGI